MQFSCDWTRDSRSSKETIEKNKKVVMTVTSYKIKSGKLRSVVEHNFVVVRLPVNDNGKILGGVLTRYLNCDEIIAKLEIYDASVEENSTTAPQDFASKYIKHIMRKLRENNNE